jgi:DNA-binding response OmpR family regulator
MPRAALLIEDNTVVREVITAHLDQAGTSVTTACDALDAEDRLEADPRIEMLVMDVDLPGRSGIDAITALRAKGDRTPCVLITGGTLDPPPVDRMQVLRKPFGMEPLIATMRSLLATCESGADTEHHVS